MSLLAGSRCAALPAQERAIQAYEPHSLPVNVHSDVSKRSYSACVPTKNQTIVAGFVRTPTARYDAVIRTDHTGNVGCTCLN